ncbi:hypothetical protein [Nocardiopsis halotolerans]|uniref:hypothetical protein n=1 Tax=Nocardiopsis halotolerans TaxID=124252 RepID=UPI0003493E68|nr:hypothetical protein [Nocardiopsis halotolerans]
MSAPEWTLGAPADGRSTFLHHITSLFAEYGEPPWPDGGRPFPDDPPDWANAMMSSVVLDGIRTHHFGIDAESDRAEALAGLIARTVEAPPDTAAAQRFHDALAETDALTVVDHLLEPLAAREVSRRRTRVLARWTAEHGTHRDAVKIALALLGLCGDERERDLLVLLGSLDEFALYAAVALRRAVPDPEPDLFRLARRATGWGRIHAVKRLEGVTDPDIRAWLLREGFRNGVMDEYLAHFAAVNGGLLEALAGDGAGGTVDDALLDGAGGILGAMAVSEGGPAAGLADYPDAFDALERYAELLDAAPATLGRLTDLVRIRDHLLGEPGGLGRPADEVARIGRRLARILERPEWEETVRVHLAEPEGEDFGAALWAADGLGLRSFDDVLRRLRVRPRDSLAWHWAFRWADREHVDDLVELAQALLPLEELATGPSEASSVGPGYEDDRALESVLHCLARTPGSGWPLLRTGLRNRCVGARAAAVSALEEWREGPLSAEAVSVLRLAEAEEPHAGTRERMSAVLGRLDPGSGVV